MTPTREQRLRDWIAQCKAECMAYANTPIGVPVPKKLYLWNRLGDIEAILSRVTPSDESAELNYAKSLATSMWEKHYAKEAPQWELCDDLYGVLSQIDNMLTGLQREKPSAPRVVTSNDDNATSMPAARVTDGNDVCGELVSFIQVGEVARDGDIGRVTMYLPYSFIGRTVYLYDHAYRYQTDNSCTHGETYWKNRAHAAEDKIASQPLMDVCRQCDECAPYLKKDETPAQRIERERKDVTACLRLLQIERKLTDIDRLVDRFLAWPLPPSVCPDGCVMDSSYPHRIGTHLLTAEEAKAMFIHALGRDELLEADHKTGEKA
ncbi:hypothetical protein [Dyella jiangningensis]